MSFSEYLQSQGAPKHLTQLLCIQNIDNLVAALHYYHAFGYFRASKLRSTAKNAFRRYKVDQNLASKVSIFTIIVIDGQLCVLVHSVLHFQLLAKVWLRFCIIPAYATAYSS